MPVGYAGCGKTTISKEWVSHSPENRARVSRDDLRATLFNSEGILTTEQERVVTKVLNAQIVALIKEGKDLIIDATNLNQKFAKQLAAFCIKNGAESVDTRWLEIPAANCIIRDNIRKGKGERFVGADVINGMAKRYPMKNWPDIHLTNEVPPIKQYVPDPELPKTITIDIDGTIADLTKVRGPYDTSRYHLDTPHPEIVELARIYKVAKFQVVFLSGRSEDFYDVTMEWLIHHTGFKPDALIMRKSGDLRNDAIIKPELFWEFVAPNYQVRLHVDDRQRVVDAMRGIGLPVLQCRPGDF